MNSHVVVVPTAASMHALGRRLAALLRAGDLVLACGELGAGKTALTQGIGAGLDVEGAVISPTFVLSRVHHSRRGGPTLVHVDAYRLAGLEEVEDLDLDASLADSVTVVEWGEGKAEQLSDDRLDVVIQRSSDPDDETRTVTLTGVGPRWAAVDLAVDPTPEDIDE
ncbi:MAG TPA: tRNA (adenosine(37)-N6)-threonylcarbamoyltransferase complex ATPase subunit type 1 TsaE [Propionibacteriaceae bacterium]|nr:tRNA (adenosine(37)-N6)-threonylcarbamoyltransferase complex ATPase subunit type 1 TsaE [Propionibacteriaceae bacterium]